MNFGDNRIDADTIDAAGQNATFSFDHFHYHHCCHNDERLSLASQHQLSGTQDYTAPALLTTQTGHFQLFLSAVRLQRITQGLCVCVCVFELSNGSLTQIRLLSIQHTGEDLSHSTSAGLCRSVLHVISKRLYLF